MAEHYCRNCKACDCDCGQDFDPENCQYCKECAGQGWSPDPEASVVFAHRDGIFVNRDGKTTKLPSVNEFLKTASTDDVRGLNAYMNRDIVRKKALAWVEKQPGQDAPSIHILNLLDIVSGLEVGNQIGIRRNGGDPADIEVRVWVGHQFAVVRLRGNGDGNFRCELVRYESEDEPGR